MKNERKDNKSTNRKIGDSRSDNWALQGRLGSKADNTKLAHQEEARSSRTSEKMTGGNRVFESRTGAEMGNRDTYPSIGEEGRPTKYSRNEPRAKSARAVLRPRAYISDQQGRSIMGETILRSEGKTRGWQAHQ